MYCAWIRDSVRKMSSASRYPHRDTTCCTASSRTSRPSLAFSPQRPSLIFRSAILQIGMPSIGRRVRPPNGRTRSWRTIARSYPAISARLAQPCLRGRDFTGHMPAKGGCGCSRCGKVPVYFRALLGILMSIDLQQLTGFRFEDCYSFPADFALSSIEGDLQLARQS